MAATLTIARTNLSLSALVLGQDVSTGFTLDPQLSIGDVTWRKRTEEQDNVAGRYMTDYVRAASEVRGSVTCYGDDEEDLQDRLAEIITALTQVDATLGFQEFNMTYTHGTAVYKWACTEPADLTPGVSGTLEDSEMANLMQPVGFVIVRNPIPIEGPI